MSLVRSQTVGAAGATRGSRRGRLAAVVLTGILTAGAVVGGAPAASADKPRCTGTGWRVFRGDDGWYVNGSEVYFPAHSPDQDVNGPYPAGGEVFVGEGYWSCSLVQGSTGSGVRELQSTLNFCYPAIIGTPLSTDGQFGTKTRAALIKVQQYHGIGADGQYGPQTARSTFHRFTDWHAGGGSYCLSLPMAGWPGDAG